VITTQNQYQTIAQSLSESLNLQQPPVAICFAESSGNIEVWSAAQLTFLSGSPAIAGSIGGGL
jgi:hypothetical protein